MATVLMSSWKPQSQDQGVESAGDLAQIETVLQNAADRVNRAPLKCDYGQYVKAAAQAAHGDRAKQTARTGSTNGRRATVAGTWNTRWPNAVRAVPQVLLEKMSNW